jgi:hypothetical protein
MRARLAAPFSAVPERFDSAAVAGMKNPFNQ